MMLPPLTALPFTSRSLIVSFLSLSFGTLVFLPVAFLVTMQQPPTFSSSRRLLNWGRRRADLNRPEPPLHFSAFSLHLEVFDRVFANTSPGDRLRFLGDHVIASISFADSSNWS